MDYTFWIKLIIFHQWSKFDSHQTYCFPVRFDNYWDKIEELIQRNDGSFNSASDSKVSKLLKYVMVMFRDFFKAFEIQAAFLVMNYSQDIKGFFLNNLI